MNMLKYTKHSVFCLLFFNFCTLQMGCTKIEREYYPNRKLKSETHYRFGKETGTTIYYHHHYPTKIMEVEMKRGKKNGRFIQRHFNDNPKLIAYYKNDILEGVEKHYYLNGNISMEINYSNGLKNGTVNSWYINGVISEKGAYVNDLFDGEWENYDERGMLVGEATFKSGTGKRMTYDSFGRLQCETNFVNNIKDGLETYYLPSGQIEKTYLFKENRIIEVNGIPIDRL